MARDDVEVTREEISAAPDLPSVIRLLQRLREANASADQEQAHVYADDLLSRAIILLAEPLGLSVQAQAEALLGEYDTVPKWYA